MELSDTEEHFHECSKQSPSSPFQDFHSDAAGASELPTLQEALSVLSSVCESTDMPPQVKEEVIAETAVQCLKDVHQRVTNEMVSAQQVSVANNALGSSDQRTEAANHQYQQREDCFGRAVASTAGTLSRP